MKSQKTILMITILVGVLISAAFLGVSRYASALEGDEPAVKPVGGGNKAVNDPQIAPEVQLKEDATQPAGSNSGLNQSGSSTIKIQQSEGPNKKTALPAQSPTCAVGKNLYILRGLTLIELDAQTLAENRRVVLPAPALDPNKPSSLYGMPSLTANDEYLYIVLFGKVNQVRIKDLELIKAVPLPEVDTQTKPK